MNASGFTAEQLDFLSRFFGPGNALRWEAFTYGTMSEQTREHLSPFLDDLRLSHSILLFPHVTEEAPASTTWYGIASDARHARALKEQLTAFVGPTYTDFTGQQAVLDDRMPVEAVLKQYFAPYVFRLRVLKADDRQEVRQQIGRLRNLREQHPDRATQVVRPIGRILRDLEMAILVRNETTARECLNALRLRGRLSAHNLTFLNVRILAAFERWSELRTLPTYRPLLDNRRPARVTEALIKCIYEEHFAAFETERNASDCIARYCEKESTFGTLFRTRGPISDPAVLKAWVLRAVARDDHNQTRTLLEVIPVDHPDRVWAETLASHLDHTPEDVAPASVVPFIEQARQALQADNFDTAFELLLQCEATVEVIRQIILCAYEINTLATTHQAVQFVGAVPDDLREQALTRRSIDQAWAELAPSPDDTTRPPVAIDSPHDWLSWIDRLNTSGPWPVAVEIARRGCTEWKVNSLRTSPDHIAQIADHLIAGRSPEATSIVRTVLPELIGFFCPEDGAIREFKPIYLSLLYLLALDDAIGADDLTALERLAEAVLESAPSTSGPAGSNEFGDLLDTLETAWQQVRSFRHLDWAMSVLDLLIAFNIRQHTAVDRFLHNIVDGFRDWSRRIRDDQWDLIDLLASDLNQPELLHGLRPADESQQIVASPRTNQLKGKTVAIYTLTERIGHRAAQLIERVFEGVKIQLLHDTVASDRLIQLAKTADIFIVNTWDAKHAATNRIKETRRPPQITLEPKSKSPSALMAVLEGFLAIQPESRQ